MNKIKCLTNNQLKIIACISMLFDHLGFMVFPKLIIFRILGRLAFPIFAFMIAEGCYYTRNKLKHFLTIFVIGVVMQIVLYFAMGMTDFSIFLVFSVSIILIYIFNLVEKLFKNKNHILGTLLSILLTGLIISLVWFTDKYDYFKANYNFYGIITPFVIYILKKYTKKYYIPLSVVFISIASCIHAINISFLINILGVFGALLLFLYNGKRGKTNLKYFFYLFYPLHFVFVYLIYLIIH